MEMDEEMEMEVEMEEGPSSGYAFKYRKLARRDECAHPSQKQKHNQRQRVDVQREKCYQVRYSFLSKSQVKCF